jgi:AcrR family transcriptional regulator
MGQRERLMAAAKKCLEELGYARTTTRDLAAAADANIASVNYHYGSKDALLIAALIEMTEAWGEEEIRPAGTDQDAAATWRRTVASFPSRRSTIVAALESLAQAERIPEVRAHTADAFERARATLGTDVYGLPPGTDERTVRAVSSVHMALLAGLTQQWLIDPENAPSGEDVVLGLRTLLEAL